MKIVGLDRVLRTPKGEPLTSQTGTTWLLGDAIYALCSQGYTGMSDDEKLSAYKVCKRLSMPGKETDLDASESALVQKIVKKTWGPMGVGVLCDALESGGIGELCVEPE